MTRKFIYCAILSLVLILSLTPCGNIPETPAGNFQYEYNEEAKGIIITKYTGSDVEKVKIPNQIDDLPVTAIGANAFYKVEIDGMNITYGHLELTCVIIPDSVTIIDEAAFMYCTNLKSVIIPDGVTYIGNWAFNSCSALAEVKLPEKLMYIGIAAFQACEKLSKINIPDGVLTIKSSAFSECISLKSVSLPDTIAKIEGYTFKECSALTNISLPDSVEEIGYGTFDDCTALTGVSYKGTTYTYDNINELYSWVPADER